MPKSVAPPSAPHANRLVRIRDQSLAKDLIAITGPGFYAHGHIAPDEIPVQASPWGESDMEEWWGRTFEKRGTVTLISMAGDEAVAIRKLPTRDVLELIRSEDTRSVRGLLAHMERRRREEWTARFALVISILALAVSIVAVSVQTIGGGNG